MGVAIRSNPARSLFEYVKSKLLPLSPFHVRYLESANCAFIRILTGVRLVHAVQTCGQDPGQYLYPRAVRRTPATQEVSAEKSCVALPVNFRRDSQLNVILVPK